MLWKPRIGFEANNLIRTAMDPISIFPIELTVEENRKVLVVYLKRITNALMGTLKGALKYAALQRYGFLDLQRRRREDFFELLDLDGDGGDVFFEVHIK